MEIIVSALKEKGYDPYAQLYGYLKENNPVYITQNKNARALIETLDKKLIKHYIDTMKWRRRCEATPLHNAFIT